MRRRGRVRCVVNARACESASSVRTRSGGSVVVHAPESVCGQFAVDENRIALGSGATWGREHCAWPWRMRMRKRTRMGEMQVGGKADLVVRAGGGRWWASSSCTRGGCRVLCCTVVSARSRRSAYRLNPLSQSAAALDEPEPVRARKSEGWSEYSIHARANPPDKLRTRDTPHTVPPTRGEAEGSRCCQSSSQHGKRMGGAGRVEDGFEEG